MPKQLYALEPNGPKRLEVSWRGLWKDFTVKLDGQVVGVLPNQKALKEGGDFPLPDGSRLTARLKTGLQTELRIEHDGRPLPGSDADPKMRLKLATGVVYFVGGLNVVVGLLAWLAQVEFLLELGIGWTSAAFGALFLALGFFVNRRSRVALAIAVALFIADGVITLVAAAALTGRVTVPAVFMRVVLLLPMLQGFGAMKALDRADAMRKAVEEF